MIDFVPDPSLYPFDSRWFDSSAGRVHYVDEGTGPPIVFCHGSPTWSFLYRHIVKGLRDRYRCIAVDHLGFGLSERPAGFGYTVSEHTTVMGELIDHLQLDDFVLMGQDWGGPKGSVLRSRAQSASGESCWATPHSGRSNRWRIGRSASSWAAAPCNGASSNKTFS